MGLIWAHLGDPADQEGGEDGVGLGDGDGLLLEEAGHLACGRCSLSSGWFPHKYVFFKCDYLPFDGSAFLVQVTPCEFDQNDFPANVGMRFVSYTFSVLLLGTDHSAYDQDPELRVWISGAPPQRDHHGSEGLPQFPLSTADRGAQ